MDSTEDRVLCSHCNKDVAKGNLSIHEVHCRRFLCVCPACKESVPKEQLEKHKEEQHTVVRCQKCNMKMERCKLPDHETDECSERTQTCEFCELELPLSALKAHAVTCGSRTDRCPDCKQYVTLKGWKDHAQICSSALSEDDASKNEDSLYEDIDRVSGDNLQDDQKSGGFLSDDQSDLYTAWGQGPESAEPEEPPGLTFSSRAQQKNGGGGAVGYEDVNQISTCPHCHLALPLQTLQWHKDKCKIFESLKLID